jgi:hypothetical protein
MRRDLCLSIVGLLTAAACSTDSNDGEANGSAVAGRSSGPSAGKGGALTANAESGQSSVAGGPGNAATLAGGEVIAGGVAGATLGGISGALQSGATGGVSQNSASGSTALAPSSGGINAASSVPVAGSGTLSLAGAAGSGIRAKTAGSAGVLGVSGTAGLAGSSPTRTFAGAAGSAGASTAAPFGGAGVAGSASVAGSAGASACTTLGATECNGPWKLRTCNGGIWEETPCTGYKVCSVGVCRDACPGLVTQSDTSAVCYMPIDPISSWHGAPVMSASVTSDQSAFPKGSMSGGAIDTLDQLSSSNEIGASSVPAPVGLVWRTDAPTSWAGRLYLASWMDLSSFVATYGGRPKSITLHIRMRRIDDAIHPIPDPLFSLIDGSSNYITMLESIASDISPTTEWSTLSRAFTSDEVNLMTLDENGNLAEVDFAGTYPSTPPQNVEVAWFALSFQHPD